MEKFIGSKALLLNLQKSAYMIIGGKKERKKLLTQLQNNPLMLCGQRMTEVKVMKYLGDYVSVSNEESVHETIVKRLGIAKQSISEIKAVVEDVRAEHIGGINLAFSLWDGAVSSMLLHNAESWCKMKPKPLKMFNSL